MFATEAPIDNRKKNLLSSNISPTCPYNIVNFGLLAAEIVSLVRGTPANFNGFRILAALLHGTLVLGVSETLQHWTESASYIWQGAHYVGHSHVLVSFFSLPNLSHLEGWWRWALVTSPDGVAPSQWLVCLPLLIFPCTMKSRSFSSGTGSPG